MALAGLAVGAAAAWFALRDLRLGDLAAVLAAIGPASLLVFVPQVASIGLDVLAWQLLLARLSDVVAYGRLVRVRVAAEFMAVVLPGGAVIADGTLSVLLTRWYGVRSPDAVASVAARKLIIWRAHGVCLLLASLGALAGLGSAVTRSRPVIAALLGGTLLVALLSALLAVLAGAGRPAERVRWLLLKLPSARLRQALEDAEHHFHATDARVAAAARTRAVRAHLIHVVAWMARAAEPWVILRLAGAPLSYVDALAAEALVGLLRSAAVLVPAGLGVQELGWSMFLRASGAPDPAALTGALALLRRAREAAWATAGYVLLLKRPAGEAATPPEEAA
jgi:glycosyltransferase 2 family protein